MARDPYRYFRIEARELHEQLSRDALELEKSPSPEVVGRMLRAAHTLKGAARVVRRTDIGDSAHAIEDVLEPLRRDGGAATAAQIDALLGHLDHINVVLSTLAEATPTDTAPTNDVPAATSVAPSPSPSPSPSPAGPSPAPRTAATEAITEQLFTPIVETEALQSVRVDIREMDNLLDGFGDAYSHVETLRQQACRLDTLRSLTAALGNRLRATALYGAESGFDAARRAADMQDLLQQIATEFDDIGRGFASGIEQLDRSLGAVRTAAERIRLVPTDNLFSVLERAARDAAQVYGKPVRFSGNAGAVRLDAQALVIVQAALAHAVRNAVAHGIETAEVRRAAGKDPVGTIAVGIAQYGKQIVLTCSDDGGGIDFDAVRTIALQRGVDVTDRGELLQLLLKGGISTSDTVTEVAGRGIGLDAIRDAAERLGGRLGLRSEPGSGTTLTLTAPLFFAAMDVLEVEHGDDIAALPLDAVRRTYRIAPRDIVHTERGAAIEHDGRSIPFRPLALALAPGRAGDWFARTWSAIVIGSDDGLAAIGVERLRGTTSVVVRPLPPLTPALPTVAGLALDAAGDARLVLDPAGLIRAVANIDHTPIVVETSRLPILVVDDSLTTRMLERSILESAGYEVELAVSAEDALEKASRTRYALFLVDVEMPGMDGFGFVERIRGDPALRETPAILVTSRVSNEDLQRGRDVGANHHIAKSAFDQDEFLAYIRELVR